MADVIADGMTVVHWLPACANINAPTTAEYAAGIDMTSQITSDGLVGWEADNAAVDNTGLNSTTDTNRAGRDALTGPMLRFKRQMPTDNVRSTLTKGTLGFVSVRRSIAATTAIAATQAASVFPVEVGRRKDLPLEKNTMERFEIPFFNHTAPAYDAVIA